jgi:hypothetical protein
MPLVLTCDCGARFQVDDSQTSKEVSCPECQQPLSAKKRGPTVQHTSWLALFSLALAITGAFTVVGSLAGAFLGMIALGRIRAVSDRLAGRSIAITGILLGLGFTVLTLGLLWQQDTLPVGAWIRHRTMTGQMEKATTPQVSSRDDVCVLTRPSSAWAVFTRGTSGDPAVDDLQHKRDVLLGHLQFHAYVDILTDTSNNPAQLANYRAEVIKEFQRSRPPLLGDDEDDKQPLPPNMFWPVSSGSELEPIDGYAGHEWVFDVDRGGQTWRFLVRVYRQEARAGQRSSVLYVLRVYAPRNRFKAREVELREVLDRVRFSP